MVQPHEPEFEQVLGPSSSIILGVACLMCFSLQALNELTQSLQHFLAANPSYKKALDVVQIPERILQFRVIWEDDKGVAQVNRGYRVQVRADVFSADHQLLTLPVQLCSGTLQGRTATPSLRQPFHPQVPWFRAGIQECSYRS